MDRLVMASMASDLVRTRGGRHTEADSFLTDVARGFGKNADEVVMYCARGSYSVYQPPKEADRVVMFADGSGAYVHSDGFVTPMDSDIRGEVHAWKLLEGPGVPDPESTAPRP